jgi:hypothetical protein
MLIYMYTLFVDRMQQHQQLLTVRLTVTREIRSNSSTTDVFELSSCKAQVCTALYWLTRVCATVNHQGTW